MLLSRYTIHSRITKYKKTRRIANLAGYSRKRKTITGVDKFIQRKIKVNHRKSALSIKHEIMDELKSAISSQTIHHPAYEFR